METLVKVKVRRVQVAEVTYRVKYDENNFNGDLGVVVDRIEGDVEADEEIADFDTESVSAIGLNTTPPDSKIAEGPAWLVMDEVTINEDGKVI